MTKTNFRYKLHRKILIFWAFFIGIGAICGAITMFIDPLGTHTGMAGLLPGMQKLPLANTLYRNLIFPGIALLLVNGIPNIIAGILLIKNKKSGIILGTILGITLMMWICIQFVIYPLNFMSTTYFIFGILQFFAGIFCLVGFAQSQFIFDKNEYKNIGTNNNKLVVYFSRTGYTKKLAYEIANNAGAEILEITTNEKISGDLGFFWCGRFGLIKQGMEINQKDIDIEKYDEVIICSPVWVFDISAPIREFCNTYSGRIKNVRYVITHFVNNDLNYIATHLDNLLNTKHISFTSIRCRYGKLKHILSIGENNDTVTTK